MHFLHNCEEILIELFSCVFFFLIRLEMGFKRPLDDTKFLELPFKHSRQLGFSDKSTQFEETTPRHAAVLQKPLATGKY